MSNDDPNFVADWLDDWKDVEADIAITLGIEPVSASDTHVELAMPFRSEIGQRTGLFSAGALIQLADVAATAVCLRAARKRQGEGERLFPLAVQMNAHLMGNTSNGRAIAHSKLLSTGKTVMTAHTTVRDDTGKDLVLLTSTHVVKSIRS